MRIWLFLVLIVSSLSLQASAVTLRVLSKSGTQIFESYPSHDVPLTVGDITVAAFDEASVPYVGGSFGMSKIFGLGSELVVISDTEFKAYGWCFEIDGVVPETMADQTLVGKPNSILIWFYAFAHSKDGQWIGQCVRDSEH